MDHARVAAKLLDDVASARARIAASYVRLWRAREPPPLDPARPAGTADGGDVTPESRRSDSETS